MTLALNLFFQTAMEQPVYFVSVVVTVVVSVTLHELGHAYAAIWQGDETPRLAGRLTLNPVAHMGVVSLVVLMVAGIAWGSTPVNPSRFRSRYGDALVSAAGPAVNLLLAFVGLTVLGLWLRLGGPVSAESVSNLQFFLSIFGVVNLVLLLFNLLPLPPLDGSAIVASFVPPYRRLIQDPNNQAAITVVFLAVFFLAGRIYDLGFEAAGQYLSLFRA